KTRQPLCIRAQCVLTTTTTASAVVDMEKLQLTSLEAHLRSLAMDRSMAYVGSVGPPTK
ncbi:hypothetical protein MKW94_004045, partial [Papaver nudicaule]|nr:hypothetical protein [Papaver nudicaule]